MSGVYRLGRLAGIDVYISFGLFIAIILLTVTLSSGWLPRIYPNASSGTYILLGLISSLFLFLSILLHELGHSLVARAHGLKVKNIVLFIFGGVSNIEQEARTPGADFQIAIIGPLVSIGIGLLCFGLWWPLRQSSSAIQALLEVLFVMNLVIGVFNLIPGYPLDGGRVLRAVFWKITGNANRATRITTGVGSLIAYLFIIWGIFQVFSGDVLDGIWIGFIGWFLLSASNSVRAQATFDEVLGDVTVEEVMVKNPVTVPANISLQKVIDDYFLPQALRSAFVMQASWLAGIITLNEIRHIPREKWSNTPIGLVMIPSERLHIVAPKQQLREVLPLMTGRDVNQLPVVEDGQLLGVLNRDVILRSIELRRSLR
ncbi:site-2 protease family protein [Tengunoibacter tsumagoiensis]|uniref:Zinc metalloprotease n=1 Tax=Tengunoibacter tsumagoiensis TaxID=2014871 RepID=A0A401ZZ62_9CHLR|nr:site-2 protease family protein [Tengunoibacter tsumagoiensis]GCE12137.1 peptidase M50 [Tengunoibacter tsumagoiensis]